MFFRKNLDLITLVILAKLFILAVFSFWLFTLRNVERLPMMADQALYLHDIRMIRNDPGSALLSDEYYWSDKTLYPRVCGLIDIVLQVFYLPSLYSALLVNLASHLLIAFFMTKLYILAQGRYPGLLFVVLSFSPTLSAYSFFALRDLFVLVFFSAFLYFIFNSRYVIALLISCIFIVLRKWFIIFCLIVLALKFAVGLFLRARHKILSISMSAFGMLIALYLVLASMGLTWVTSAVSRHDPGYLLFASVGLSRFYAEEAQEEGNTKLVTAEAGTTARILMFDSMTLPVLALGAMIIILRRGSLLQKQLTLVAMGIALGLTVAYIGLVGNFPMRKLLQSVPLLYLVVFLGFEQVMGSKPRRNFIPSPVTHFAAPSGANRVGFRIE